MSFSSDNAQITNQLPITLDLPKDPEKFREILGLRLKEITNTVNSKGGGLFSLAETGNSEQFFTSGNPQTFRNVYRKTFDLVEMNGRNIAGGATVSFPHTINSLRYGALIYATCTSVTPEYFTVVYSNVSLDAINVNFTNPLPSTELSAVYVIAEYLKN